MLRDGRDFEISKDENKNKNVIDAERILDEVAGEKIQGAVRPLGLGHDQAEAEREHHPKQTAQRCRPHCQRTMAALEAGQVDREGNENADMKCDPKPNARRHGGNRFTLEQRWQRELPSTIAGQL
jgi:hypothetical protein